MRPIGNYQWLPEGMNITVTKTLSDDVEIFLEARILKNDGNMLILDKPLIVDKPTLEKMKDKYKVKRAQLRYKVFEFSV